MTQKTKSLSKKGDKSKKASNEQKNGVNVEQIMKEIRAKIEHKKQNNLYPENLESQADTIAGLTSSSKDLKQLERCVDELSQYSYIHHDLITSSKRPIFGPLITFIKKVIRKLTSWYFKSFAHQINAFNDRTYNAINETYAALNKLNNVYSSMSQDLNRVQKEIDVMIGENKSTLLENNYLSFENKFRGPEDTIKKNQKHLVKYFIGKTDVLDIGCGRGEFLEVLADEKIKATGIDSNPVMIDKCNSKGLSAVKQDALEYLKNIENNKLGGIFCGQVVQHLNINYLTSFLETCYRKLQPGAHVVIETPNPLSLIATASFSRDITHNKILHADTLIFILEHAGFTNSELKFISPITKDQKLEKLSVAENEANNKANNLRTLNSNIEKLNKIVYGDQDYIVAARKPKDK